jgi:hypothetical protein
MIISIILLALFIAFLINYTVSFIRNYRRCSQNFDADKYYNVKDPSIIGTLSELHMSNSYNGSNFKSWVILEVTYPSGSIVHLNISTDYFKKNWKPLK